MTAIYARQSIERIDSVSIETQLSQCLKIAPTNDYILYSDVGYSGKTLNRPNFEKMINDMKNGTIKTIISYRLDRISRSITDFANLINLFEQHHVQYISATEQFDTSSPMGRAMIYIVMVFAQLERETITQRITDNYRFRASQGLYMGGNAPFGYSSKKININGKKTSVLVENNRIEDLKLIFDLYQSRSIHNIVHYLNNNGISTTKGGQWSAIGIKRILENISSCVADEKLYDYLDAMQYIILNDRSDFTGEFGTCLFFKHKNKNQSTEISEQLAVVGLHKPFISSEKWINTQILLKQHCVSTIKKSKQTFLAGLVTCKSCGYSFGIKNTTKKNKHYSYYHCRGRSEGKVCNNKEWILSQQLENCVVECFQKHLFDNKINYSLKIVDKIKSFDNHEIDRLEQQIQHLIENIGKGNAIVDNLLTDKITNLKLQIEMIKESSKKFPQKIILNQPIDFLKKQLEIFTQFHIDDKADLMQCIINKIYINDKGEINIEYKF